MFDSIPIVQAFAAQFTGLEVPTRLVVKLVGEGERKTVTTHLLWKHVKEI